jgi:cardiolipin synthase
MFPPPASRASLTIPNLITLVRIFLTPVFIIFITRGQYRHALAVFLLAGVSDLADGLIARLWQQRSPLGTYLDPLADKLLLSSTFLTLGIYHQIPAWLTALVLSRDITLALGALVLKLTDYPLVIRPSLAGKWTTTLQIACVLLVLIKNSWGLPPYLLGAWFILTGSLTAASGAHYIAGGLKLVAQGPNHRSPEGPHGRNH